MKEGSGGTLSSFHLLFISPKCFCVPKSHGGESCCGVRSLVGSMGNRATKPFWDEYTIGHKEADAESKTLSGVLVECSLLKDAKLAVTAKGRVFGLDDDVWKHPALYIRSSLRS